jgi:D-glycero-D-manno-heptose 1,7-bisphosphate phosphatase
MYSRKIAFLDRDGVINKKAPPHQYITKVKDFKFNKGIFKLLKILQVKGYEFIIITNQRGIARGIFTKKKLDQIHKYMIKKLKEKGIRILDIFYCPHEKNSCNCRKPKPGLIHQALNKYAINLVKSILISDNEKDIIMGQSLGIEKCFKISYNKLQLVIK